jgi:hypothetical protein
MSQVGQRTRSCITRFSFCRSGDVPMLGYSISAAEGDPGLVAPVPASHARSFYATRDLERVAQVYHPTFVVTNGRASDNARR